MYKYNYSLNAGFRLCRSKLSDSLYYIYIYLYVYNVARMYKYNYSLNIGFRLYRLNPSDGCICICMCVYIHICEYIYIYIRGTNVPIQIYISRHIYTFTYASQTTEKEHQKDAFLIVLCFVADLDHNKCTHAHTHTRTYEKEHQKDTFLIVLVCCDSSPTWITTNGSDRPLMSMAGR